ncbi:hypothetical protein MIMGU_mgv1a015232mg [Erythranthe guttata]|uniref:Uncharacterized protein n=1 Tax=Erythranthe guttata TaxID=4155 RepID=A0A022PUH8_ERYGU|nr:hypothetical protein MIMGU_mgv1a015232mg [Erythranthe guttata]
MEVANQFPDGSKLKEAAQLMEHASAVAAQDAQLIENIIHKAGDVKQDLQELETMLTKFVLNKYIEYPRVYATRATARKPAAAAAKPNLSVTAALGAGAGAGPPVGGEEIDGEGDGEGVDGGGDGGDSLATGEGDGDVDRLGVGGFDFGEGAGATGEGDGAAEGD